MGVLLLSAEIDKADTEDQQHPAEVKAHGTVAEVRIAAGGLGVILALKDIGTGKSTCSCDERLLAWGCIPGGQAVAALVAARSRVVAASCSGTTLVTFQRLS